MATSGSNKGLIITVVILLLIILAVAIYFVTKPKTVITGGGNTGGGYKPTTTGSGTGGGTTGFDQEIKAATDLFLGWLKNKQASNNSGSGSGSGGGTDANTQAAYEGCNADGTSATGDNLSNYGFPCDMSPNYNPPA